MAVKILAVVLVSLPFAAGFASTREEQPPAQSLQLTADEIVFDAPKNTLSASGGVRVSGESLVVTCGKVTVTLAEKERTVQRVEATENVDLTLTYSGTGEQPSYQVTSHSQRAILMPQDGKFSALGEAEVVVHTIPPTEESYRLLGEQIDFDLASRTLTARKGVEQPKMEVTLPRPKTEEP